MHAFLRHCAVYYLRKVSVSYMSHTHQLACFAFDVISESIMVDGAFEKYELELLEKAVFPHLPANGDCLDIGANIGHHAIFFSDHFRTVYAFEPNPKTFELLRFNSSLVTNVYPCNYGLSSKSQSVQATLDRRNMGGASIEPNSAVAKQPMWRVDNANFELRMLDECMAGEETCTISFLKIDVEGHEYEVLLGGRSLIEKNKPVIALEILPNSSEEGPPKELRFLEALGYEYSYEMARKSPFIQSLPRLSRLFTICLELVTGKRADRNLCLKPLVFDSSKTYPMLICSTVPLGDEAP